ncbi:hypothetical protein [Methylophaga sp. SB9B]|uniref:hypothetical protein n=1 Tax=Methylophaga sp. SB9B TaxID=2570356 RepID=UPI001FFEE324|nr:hypothetical protein [Methylophaga sp. SB9B]
MKKSVFISLIAGLLLAGNAYAQPLKIGYSDWPGWVAWEIAIEKTCLQKSV